MLQRMNFGLIAGQQLDGEWGLLPDPMDRCRAQHWWNSRRREGQFFPSYDDDAFWPTTVPGAAGRCHPELAYYEGTLVYLHHFDARACGPDERAFLHFGGVADRAGVFLNGQFLGEHDGGYTPWTVEVGHALAEHNRLMVLVNGERREDGVPGWRHDWWHESGIHRPVTLYYRPRNLVREVALQTRLEGDQVALTCRVLIGAGRRDVTHQAHIHLSDPGDNRRLIDITLPCHADSWSETTVRLPRRDVRLWDLEDPYLHRLSVRLGDDHWQDEVGLRELRTHGHDILVNGQPVILRGMSVWLEDPLRGIFSLGKESSEEAVKILRDLNCNHARAGHQPGSEEFLRACDRAGILVWMEVPAYWLPKMHKVPQSRRALQAIAEMIRAHRNRPGVAIWSIGNECLYNRTDSEESNLDYFLEAADLCHELDPSRLVTYTGGMEGDGKESIELILPDAIIDKLDVIAFNSYAGINDGSEPDRAPEFPQQYDKARRAASFGKPVIHAEVGIDAVLGEQGFDFGEERQAQFHRQVQDYFAELVDEGVLQGLTLFVLNDYRTPIKLGRHQRGYNRKGLITADLEPKPAYRVVKEGYARIAKRGK